MIAFLKKFKVLLIILVLISAGAIAFSFSGNGQVETVTPRKGDLVRSVDIAGKVIPQDSVALGFEISGTVSQVHKNVGDEVVRGSSLASLDAEGLRADLLKAEADLASAQAELTNLEGAGSFETSIENAKRSLVQAMVDAYTAADDAIYNKTDQFFFNPQSGNPKIFLIFQGYEDLRESINQEREALGYILDDWKELTSGLNTTSFSEEKLSYVKTTLNRVSLFLSNVSRAVNIFEVTAGVTQTSIDKYKTDTATARSNVSTPSQSIITKENDLRNTISGVPIQVAKVESARASVLSNRAKLNKTSIISPINGVVSIQTAKVGQVVSPGTSVVSIISGEFILEAYVPEISIGGIQVGNKALITFDAFGGERVFQGEVIHIDPAETIRDGVSTYKVELSYLDPEGAARSGMTANIEIETFRKPLVTLVPERTVVRDSVETYVYIYTSSGEQKKRVVELGAKDSEGNIEILSGLSVDEKIILNP